MILHTNNELNNLEIQEIVYNPSNKIELEGSIELLEEVIDTLNKNSEIYLLYCLLLTTAYQKMIENEYWIDRNVVKYIKKSIYYCKEIRKKHPKIENNEEIPINQYVAMLEEANSLAKLADYENEEENYEKSLKLYDEVIKNTKDEQAKYLSIMNRSKVQIIIYEKNIKSFKHINKNLKKLNKIILTLKEAINFFEQYDEFEKNCLICLTNIKRARSINKSFSRHYFYIFMKYKPTQYEKINKFKKYKFEVIYD